MFATNHLLRVRPLFTPDEVKDEEEEEEEDEEVMEDPAGEAGGEREERRRKRSVDTEVVRTRTRSSARPLPYQLAVSSFVPRQRRPHRAAPPAASSGIVSSATPELDASFSSTAKSSSSLNKTAAAGTTAPPISHIIGKFQELKALSHPNICEYVEIVKGKHDRVILIAEHYENSLLDAVQKRGRVVGSVSLYKLRKYAREILSALTFLSGRGIVHRNLSARNCLLDEKGTVKLSEYGLYHITDGGADVHFPIGSPAYMAPEAVLGLPMKAGETPYERFRKSDVWSLGIILLELYVGSPFWRNGAETELQLLLRATAEFAVLSVGFPDSKRAWDQIPEGFIREGVHEPWDMLNTTVLRFLRGDSPDSMSEEFHQFREFVMDCLEPDFSRRPLPKEALCHPFLAAKPYKPAQLWTTKPYLVSDSLAPNEADHSHYSPSGPPSDLDNKQLSGLLFQNPPAFLYYFWRLAGGDVEVELAKRGALSTTPPICRCPRLVRATSETVDQQYAPSSGEGGSEDACLMTGARDSARLFSTTTTVLSLKEVKQKFEESMKTGDKVEHHALTMKNTGPPKAAEPINWDTDYFSLTEADEINFLVEGGEKEPLASQLSNSGKGPPSAMSDADYQFVDGDSVPSEFPDLLYDDPPRSNKTRNDDVHVCSTPQVPISAPAVTSFSSTSLMSPAGSLSMIKTNAPVASPPPSASATAATTPEPANNVVIPLLTREKSIVYQCRRLRLFRELLNQYPASREEIVHHAKVDVPPLLRGFIWAAVLGVTGDYGAAYRDLDKETETVTDRQIEVDVPRCHQYHPLMSSPAGHAKLKRLLKCWVSANEKLVYWQGLDSLCAPFLTLNFNCENLAFACLQLFIPRFLRNFFLYDNSQVIQEYLAVFRHLLSFHDPELSSHLDKIQFSPELYAIPWFLTLFTHVFPLDKIYHLWDKILVGPPSLPLFAGISILRQIRDVLLRSEFNECILLFSESFPEVDIEKCIGSALEMCRVTPPSVVHRVHCPTSEDYRSPVAASGAEAHCPTNVGQSAGARWWDQPLPLETKKSELAPRISLADFVLLGGRSFVVDVRSESEFERGHLQYSVNVQPTNIQGVLHAVRRRNKKYHIVVADRGNLGPEIATQLVHAFLSRVAVLTGGVDAVRLDGGSPGVAGAAGTGTGNRCALCSCNVVRRSATGRAQLPPSSTSSRGGDGGQVQFLQCSLAAPLV